MLLKVLILFATLLITSCLGREEQCTCPTSPALRINATDTSGSALEFDTVFVQFNDASTIDTLVEFSKYAFLNGSYGRKAGSYKVWANYHSIPSDTAYTLIKMGGPSGCRNLSTQGITFVFDADSTRAPILTKIGGCGE